MQVQKRQDTEDGDDDGSGVWIGAIDADAWHRSSVQAPVGNSEGDCCGLADESSRIWNPVTGDGAKETWELQVESPDCIGEHEGAPGQGDENYKAPEGTMKNAAAPIAGIFEERAKLLDDDEGARPDCRIVDGRGESQRFLRDDEAIDECGSGERNDDEGEQTVPQSEMQVYRRAHDQQDEGE